MLDGAEAYLHETGARDCQANTKSGRYLSRPRDGRQVNMCLLLPSGPCLFTFVHTCNWELGPTSFISNSAAANTAPSVDSTPAAALEDPTPQPCRAERAECVCWP